jgi:hypothetical protein
LFVWVEIKEKFSDSDSDCYFCLFFSNACKFILTPSPYFFFSLERLQSRLRSTRRRRPSRRSSTRRTSGWRGFKRGGTRLRQLKLGSLRRNRWGRKKAAGRGGMNDYRGPCTSKDKKKRKHTLPKVASTLRKHDD